MPAIMKERNTRAAKLESKIQCIEVLIPKKAIATNGHNLHWTLSVYSLENQPVKKSRSFHNSDVFHFMVYDWKRTIQQLLEDHQVHYSIIQYFTPETIFTEPNNFGLSDTETGFFSALNKLKEASTENGSASEIFSESFRDQKSGFIFDKGGN
jgi:hypothetical protein